jgi:transcriptional regulator with XRE-family HTH domain
MADTVTMQVARAIRERREQLGLTLRALAARSGVSSSMISDIERGAKSPTLSTLAALAGALQVPLAMLVDSAVPAAALIHVERSSERSPVTDPASGATRARIGPVLSASKVETASFRLPPHSVAGSFPAHASGTLEHVYLVEGSVRVTVATETVTLQAGDSCTCLADRPHAFDNSEGDEPALLYLVTESA